MKKLGLFSGLLLGGLLMASQALAVVAPVNTIYLPPSPDADGYYQLRWRPSVTAGVTYTLEEATDAGFSDATTVYTGPDRFTYIGAVTKNAAGTYFYRITATFGAESSSSYAASTPIVVSDPASLQVAKPNALRFPPTDLDGKFRVIIGKSMTPAATYELQHCTDNTYGDCTPITLASATATYADVVLPSGTYYFRARALKGTMVASDWYSAPAPVNCVVAIPAVAVGSASCVGCHTSATPAAVISWQSSRHANSNSTPTLNLTSSCTKCHNPNKEATTMIACEACHGTGEHGFPVLNAKAIPDVLATCGKCHNNHYSASFSIATKVAASKHTNGRGHNTTAKCERCHTTEGSIQFAEYTGDKTVMTLMDTANGGLPIDQITPDQGPTCAACHDHEGKMRTVAGWTPSASAEFNLCTSCHNYSQPDGTMYGSGTLASGTAPYYHNTSWYRTIPTTHYDNPATGVTAVPANNILEGYVIRKDSANPCFDCHGHELRTNTRRFNATGATADYGETIHTEWAQSGHAGKLLTTKVAAVGALTNEAAVDAVMSAGSNGAEFAWNHYPWSKTSKLDVDGVTVLGDRGDCQMCHTSTGYVNYVADPVNYTPAVNNFSHLANWTALTGSGQAELLYCWGCHTSVDSGALRVVGPVTATYTYGGAPIVFPDAGKSNSCVVCHAGRGNNEVVSTSTRFAGHHAPAAATLYADLSHVAYEYPTLSYAPPVYFAHDNIDVNGSGPCAGCHMDGAAANHTFNVVTKDVAGAITAINADVCVTCHTGQHGLFVGKGLLGKVANIWNGTAAVPTVVTQAMVDAAALTLEEEAEGYKQAGQLLKDYMNQANGLVNYTAAVINNTNVPANDVGAFQNSLLPSDDPGGFAHNRFYVKRALFDAIDWVDNGVLDRSIVDNSASYPLAAAWLGLTRP